MSVFASHNEQDEVETFALGATTKWEATSGFSTLRRVFTSPMLIKILVYKIRRSWPQITVAVSLWQLSYGLQLPYSLMTTSEERQCA